MTTLEKKITTPIIIVTIITLLVLVLGSVLFNLVLSDITEMRNLERIGSEFLELADITPENKIAFENKNGVTILSFPIEVEEEKFNEELRYRLISANIGFQKLWLWGDNLEKLVDQQFFSQKYSQGKLQYDIFINYQIKENTTYVFVKNIPHIQGAFLYLGTGFLLVVILVSFSLLYFIKKRINEITTPLATLAEATKNISQGNFIPIIIKTGDEVEILSESFNNMSKSLENTQQELKDKNIAMELLLQNVAHELKTPIALIKAYSAGIIDGLDEGDFIDEIQKQTNHMNIMIEKLLNMFERELHPKKHIDLSEFLTNIVSEYQILAEKQDIHLITNIDKNVFMFFNRNEIEVVFRNLLINAIQYGEESTTISLYRTVDCIIFEIKNKMSLPLTVEEKKHLWEPYYRATSGKEKNKKGTGLGLSLIQTILDRHYYKYDVKISDFSFKVSICFNCKSNLNPNK